MWNLHGRHCEIDKYVQVDGIDIVMSSIKLSSIPSWLLFQWHHSHRRHDSYSRVDDLTNLQMLTPVVDSTLMRKIVRSLECQHTTWLKDLRPISIRWWSILISKFFISIKNPQNGNPTHQQYHPEGTYLWYQVAWPAPPIRDDGMTRVISQGIRELHTPGNPISSFRQNVSQS
jgi:hypothetical protein